MTTGRHLAALLVVLAPLMACKSVKDVFDQDEPPPPTPVVTTPKPTATAPPVTTATSSAKPVPKSSRQSGWIPAGATQATAVDALAKLPKDAPSCDDPDSDVEKYKKMAVSIERQLRESTKISDAEERRIGLDLEKAIPKDKSFRGKWDLPADVAKYRGYLQALIDHIAKYADRKAFKYRVHVVRRKEFNAAALPGGVLMVFTGVFESPQAVRTEAELVAVLAHEIAHVDRRHTIAAYQYAKAILERDAAQDSTKDKEVRDARIGMRLLGMPISTEYENEADDHGLELAVRAQYNPTGAMNYWSRIAKQFPQKQLKLPKAKKDDPLGGLLGKILKGVAQALRSHPPHAYRACRARRRVDWARTHSPWTRLYDGKTNLAKLVPGPTKQF